MEPRGGQEVEGKIGEFLLSDIPQNVLLYPTQPQDYKEGDRLYAHCLVHDQSLRGRESLCTPVHAEGAFMEHISRREMNCQHNRLFIRGSDPMVVICGGPGPSTTRCVQPNQNVLMTGRIASRLRPEVFIHGTAIAAADTVSTSFHHVRV